MKTLETKQNQQEIFLIKFWTLVDNYERKQREFIQAFDQYMDDINDRIDNQEE